MQYQQLRRENEFVGPLVEIEYWRRQLACFTSIVEFITSEPCSGYIQCLAHVKPKLVKVCPLQFRKIILIAVLINF